MGDCAKNLQNKRDWFYGLCSTTYREHRDYHDDIQKKQQLYHFLPLMTKLTKLPSNQRKINLCHLCGFNNFYPSPSLRRFCILLFKLSWQQHHWLHVNCHSIHSTRTWWVRLHICMIQYSQHGNVLRLTYILYMENTFMWGSFWITTVTVGWLQSDCI